jgi:hypothetical protein
VTNKQLARVHFALRRRLRLRQEVATAAGIRRWKVYRLEAGEIDGLRVGDVRKAFEQLGGQLNISAFFKGAELERILDEVHARLVAAVVKVLTGAGWTVKVEVSFSTRGDRGSIDVLGWHSGERALLVIEIKSEIPGMDPLLRPLDVKVRVASQVARERFGWAPRTVSKVVVLPEDSTARRVARRHANVLRAVLPTESRDVRRWLRNPQAELAGLWFLSLAKSAHTARNPSSIRRVQRPRTRSVSASKPRAMDNLGLIDPHNAAQLRD